MIPSLEQIRPLLLSKLAEAELVKLIKNVSRGFTSERERVGEYVSEEAQVSAYAAYFLPTNIPKLHFLLDQLPSSFKDYLKESTLIDIGSGPGTYTLALRSYLKSSTEAVLIDSSELMLAQAKRILDQLAPGKTSYQRALKETQEQRGGVALFGNSLNEMGAKRGCELVAQLRPEALLLIEPGTKQSFREVLLLREYLLESGYEILYPCPSSHACPLAERDDWCHQVLRMTHECELERLSQLVQLDRKIMPTIAHAYIKKGILKVVPRAAHFLRFLGENKFSFRWQVCVAAEEGKGLRTETFEILKKDYSKKQIKTLGGLSVGVSFEYEIQKELPDFKRIRLLKVASKPFQSEG